MLRDPVSIAHSPERTSSSRGPLSFACTYWGPPWWLRVSSDYSTTSWIWHQCLGCEFGWQARLIVANPTWGPEDAQMALAWQSHERLPHVIPQWYLTWPWQWRTLGNKAPLSTSLYLSSLLGSAQSGTFDAQKRNDFYSKNIKTKKITQAICSFWISEQIFQSTIRANWFESQSLHWGYWPS